MRFLLDVCVSSHSLSAFLAGEGHDVLSAIDIDTTASDEHLLAYALKDDRILLTEDKDFGELAFVRKLRHGAVVRFVELTVAQQTDGMAELLEHHAAMLAEPARRRPGLLRILRAAHPYRNDTLQEIQLAGPAAHPRENEILREHGLRYRTLARTRCRTSPVAFSRRETAVAPS